MIEKEKQEVLKAEGGLPPEGAPMEEIPAAAEGAADPDAEKMARLAGYVKEFTRRYPQVDLRRLQNDENFLLFCGSRYGNEPLTELFADYAAVIHNLTQEASAKAESKAQRGTGSGVSGGGQTLTAEEQKALDEWNKAYPQLKMTAKEFLARE